MREDWVELQEICDLNMGQSPNSSSYNDGEEGLPFFQGNADFGNLYPTVRKWCTDPKKIVDEDSLLISVRAPIGALNFTTERCCIGRGLAGITPKKNVNLKYVYYNLKYRSEDLQNKGTGSTFKAINKGTLAETKIKDCSLEEQNKCVEVLDRITSIIDYRKEEIEQLDTLIKSRFVEMFGDPVVNDKNLECKELINVCSKITDGTHDTPPRFSEGMLLITGKNIRSNGINLSNVEYVSEDDHKVIYARCNPEKDDVLYTNIGVNYGTAALNNLDFQFSMKNVALLKPNKEVLDGCYLWFVLNLLRNKILEQNKSGGAQTFMGLATIKKIILPIPTLALQKEFREEVERINKLKIIVESSLNESQVLFDSLMQDYFE